MTLRILPPKHGYPGERLVVKSGDVPIGAIFPPSKDGGIWIWRLWLIDTAAHTLDGASRTRAEAEATIRARWAAFLERAGLRAEDTAQAARIAKLEVALAEALLKLERSQDERTRLLCRIEQMMDGIDTPQQEAQG